MTKRLQPFGKQFRPVPSSGVRVAIGPDEWNIQKRHSRPIMVLPDDANPDNFTWPSDGNPGLIHERGIYDDRLAAMAETLLRIAGRTDEEIRALVAKLEAARTAAV